MATARIPRFWVRAADCMLALGLVTFSASCGPEATDLPPESNYTHPGFDTVILGSDGTPRYLAGHLAAHVHEESSVSQVLKTVVAPYYSLAPETSFAVTRQPRKSDGLRLFRVLQLHAGYRVVGREVVVQVSRDGAVEAIIGQLAPNLRLDLTPRLSGQTAIATALGQLTRNPAQLLLDSRPSTTSIAGRVLSTPTLAIYIRDGGVPILVYSAVVEYQNPEGRAFEELFAGAQDGVVVARHPRVHTAGLNRMVYDIRGSCVHNGSELPGTLAVSEGGMSTEVAAQRAYENSGNVYWYYQFMFDRHGYDDLDSQIVSTVHATFDTGMGGCDGGNAAWLSDPFNQMVYGDGSFGGRILKEMTLGFDVAAHELSHAVTAATSKLEYLNESGALNEANSDIMGATAEAWVNSGGGKSGNPASITTTDKTWKIGEDVAGILIPGGALRFMKNPAADMASQDYYPERYTGAEDNGGVHWNSGIANLAYYLLVDGGSHPRRKTPGIMVNGIGIEKAARIFYLANTALYTSMTDFQGARYATALAAETLYGRCGKEWMNVHKAWDAVGVPGTWSLCTRPLPGF